MDIRSIGLVGYGEVGKIFGAGLKAQSGVEAVGAWDLKFAQAATRPAETGHAARAGTGGRAFCAGDRGPTIRGMVVPVHCRSPRPLREVAGVRQ